MGASGGIFLGDFFRGDQPRIPLERAGDGQRLARAFSGDIIVDARSSVGVLCQITVQYTRLADRQAGCSYIYPQSPSFINQ